MTGRGEAVHNAASSTWWGRLLSNIQGLTPTALEVLAQDSALLVQHVLPRNGNELASDAYPPDRIRTGIVVGSVQSGKTASMLALAARCLDERADILVVLAGTRIALWLQTYERLLRQLDGTTPATFHQGAARRVWIPDPSDLLGDQRVSANKYLRTQRRGIERALREQRPVVFVVPKEDDHLIDLGRFLRQVLLPSNISNRTKVLEMVVLDDEADDASVLDASNPEKLTPRLIRQLWGTTTGGATWLPTLYATYVAYTATPQANFAQETHNPLAPRNFRFVLRTPDSSGPVMPRALTYEEPAGIRSYYTGGRTFYERLRGQPGDFSSPYRFPIQEPGETDADHELRFKQTRWRILGDALRAYFVAGALRLHLSGRRFSGLGESPRPLPELRDLLPPTHSMLYHPSALTEDHFGGAEDISRWCIAVPGHEEATLPRRDAAGSCSISVEELIARLESEEDLWRAWVDRFATTAAALRAQAGGDYPRIEDVEWSTIAELLRSEVFPFTRIRVINSDPAADDRPSFDVRQVEGGYLPPAELFSIFVAGNVLSRGLTIEGLATSVFLRAVNEPAADTQMQMQRWFGYRGALLPFCRIFLFQDQLVLFRAYHANDEALKQDILHGRIEESDVLVLQGESFVATSKVATRQAPLHPGPTPAIRLVEHADRERVAHNLSIVADLLTLTELVPIEAPNGSVRGLISTGQHTLLEVALLLERLRYSTHNPDPTLALYARWRSLQSRLQIPEPLLRVPVGTVGEPAVNPQGCPYSIAAYLRLWDSVLTRHHAPGFYPTDRPTLSWHLIDLASYQQTRPRFYVAIRFGEGPLSVDPRLASHNVRVMKRGLAEGRDHLLETLWGTRGRSANYFGDQLLDYHRHHMQPVPDLRDGALWRTRGHPGLVLFHIVRHEAKGVDMVAVGLALPHGGPDHIAALRGSEA